MIRAQPLNTKAFYHGLIIVIPYQPLKTTMRQYKSEGWESLYKTSIYSLHGGKDTGTLKQNRYPNNSLR